MLLVLTHASDAGAQQSWSADHVDESLRPELDAISARGRLLAEYDQAAWHGTDAVLSLRPDSSLVGGYLARRRADGLWEVVFGKVDADANAFGSANRPYNAVVIPAGEGGDWFVYLMPAQTRPDVFPLGGDTRYRVSEDGRTLVAQRRLHNTILEVPRAQRVQGGKIQAGYHTAVLDDRPEDTDVFHVLAREPRVPEYIASKSYFFRVDLDGRITAYKQDGKP